MAKIIDPDQLTQGIEVVINSTLKTIQLVVAGNLTNDGVTGQCLYSFLKEEWHSDATLIPIDFPMESITNESFEFIKGWTPADTATRKLIRDAGWSEKSLAGALIQQHAGIISLGTIGATDQPYIQQETNAAAVNTTFDGPVNEAVQIYGDASNGDFDYRGYFKLFVREQGKTYAASTITDIGVTTMSPIVYRFPLQNASDLDIVETDTNIANNAPYTGITITYYAVNQSKVIGGSSYDFNIIIDGNNAPRNEIYEKVQYLLRQDADIDEGVGVVNGKTANALLGFVGDTLVTTTGVFIDNFQASDTNKIEFLDVTGTKRTFPFVSTLSIISNSNLTDDVDAIYRVFFTNDDAGDNLGYDFGTVNAIIANDNDGTPMSGSIGGQGTIQLTFDYDGNVQRGAGSAGVDAPITVVAIGLSTGQYVKSVGTITRSTANTVSLVATLERNYLNPA